MSECLRAFRGFRAVLSVSVPLVVAALAGACADVPGSAGAGGALAVRSAAHTAEPGEGPAAPGLPAALSLAQRVVPGGTTEVVLEATLAGAQHGTVVRAVFTGDAGWWPQADLAFTGHDGERYRFAGTLTAPRAAGRHVLSWSLRDGDGVPYGPDVAGAIEVTCSDGSFCNGEERWTVRGCVPESPPCDDGVACTVDTCDELTRTCHYEPTGAGCADCDAKKCNPKCRKRQQCGDDGCGGACVTAFTDAAGRCLGGLTCVEGRCEDVQTPGTCTNPLPLLGAAGHAVPAEGVETVTFGDSSAGIDALKLSCGGEGIPELVFRFDLAVASGIDIRSLSTSGDPDALDTVLAVHAEDCVTQLPFGGFCSDDASPPGGLSSRVYGPLEPGSYRLVVSGYSASQVGPFQLQIKIVPGCVPACDGRYCGPDGCGGACGACADGELCSSGGRCYVSPCTPDCQGRRCGDDGGGGSCGACADGELCAETEGRCVAESGCDHVRPVCKNCGPKSYCGTDCQCHRVDETLVDLLPAPADTLLPSIEFEWRSFDRASCALAEGCVPGPGRWLLMRFTTDVLNQGLAGFETGDPTDQPEIFDYHDCHQHYHFSGFANYALLTLDGSAVLAGRKLSYCMEDSYQHLFGPDIPCDARYTCEDQGIQAGWADSYPATLDCQWLVLRGTTPAPTDIAPGWYLHETCTNTGRVFHEHTFDNNCIRVPVYVPEVPDDGRVLRYTDIPLP